MTNAGYMLHWRTLIGLGAGFGLSFFLLASARSAPIAATSLADGFKQPPNSARPAAYYLMLNGYLNADYADRELTELARMGIGGLCVFDMGGRGPKETLPPAGPAFLSEAWLDQFARILHRATELGLAVQLAVSSSWDMGASWVQPEHASMALYHSVLPVAGPADLDTVLPRPAIPARAPRDARGNPVVLREVAVLAIPAPLKAPSSTERFIHRRTDIVNLTSQCAPGGRLRWSVPPGKWQVLRFVCANTGERLKVPSPASDGLATDHFNAAVTRAYLQHVIDRLQARFGDLRRTALRQLYLPSYEVRGRVWTPQLLARFREYRHYDLTPFLPALVGYTIENEALTQSFLFDFRKTMGDLLVDAYYRPASATARRAGLGIEAEAGGPGPPVHQVPVEALKALSVIDEMRGEFWPWRLDNDPLWVVKETACAAHVYGRRRVHMEAFTGFHHWAAGPFDLKYSADRAFCEGMNHVVWHTSSHQPPEAGKPGWVYGAGTHLTPNLVWWPQAKPFLDYLARCSFLLQQGRFVADVCYYYGDQGYNFIPPKHVDPALGYGFDYDVANADVILHRMRVQDGRIVLPDGMSYAVLALPERDDMNPEVLAQVARLIEQGATVVGPKPTRANGLTERAARDRRVQEHADRLWGDCDGQRIFEHPFGRGKVVWGRTLREVLQARGIGPDFQFTSSQPDTVLDFIHRRTEDADLYFIQNRTQRWESVQAQFRVRGKTPELWFPDSGRIVAQPVYTFTPKGTRLPLRLAPWGSVFVIFRSPPAARHLAGADAGLAVESVTENAMRVSASRNGSYTVQTASGESAPVVFRDVPAAQLITGPWQVRFPAGWGAPESVTFDELTSWTDHELEAIRHFSGIARYQIDFAVKPGWRRENAKLDLDLGRLWAVGEVYLNGESVGIVWKPPYRLDVTRAVQSGRNRLEIDIANTWVNRLVGDAHLPREKRRTRTNITRTGGKPWQDTPLIASGLFGPVRLIYTRTQTVKLSR